MIIQSYLSPDLSVIREARALETVCHSYDNLSGTLFLDPSLNFSSKLPCLLTLREDGEIVSLLTVFAPAQAEVELFGMTHPDHRRKGYFLALTKTAANIAREFGIDDMLFLSEPHSSAGIEAVSSLGATFSHAEYSLRYDCKNSTANLAVPDGLIVLKATPADLADMAEISSGAYSEPLESSRDFLQKSLDAKGRTQYIARLNDKAVGIGAIQREADEATIYGLAVSPRMQGRGIGRGIVTWMINDLLATGMDQILIEVDSTNQRALHLYRSCGFEPEATFHYYRVSLSKIVSQFQEIRK